MKVLIIVLAVCPPALRRTPAEQRDSHKVTAVDTRVQKGARSRQRPGTFSCCFLVFLGCVLSETNY